MRSNYWKFVKINFSTKQFYLKKFLKKFNMWNILENETKLSKISKEGRKFIKVYQF